RDGGDRDAGARGTDAAARGRRRISLRAQPDVPRRRQLDRGTGAAAGTGDLAPLRVGFRRDGYRVRAWLRGADAREAIRRAVRRVQERGPAVATTPAAVGADPRNAPLTGSTSRAGPNSPPDLNIRARVPVVRRSAGRC